MMLIRQKDKNNLINIAKQTIKTPCELIVFGSRVNGEAHDTSDLDMVIKTKSGEKLDIEEFITFKENIQESNIPIIIQTLDWYRIPKSFHENILKNHEKLLDI
jgi:predicted nucleotidyltransferase